MIGFSVRRTSGRRGYKLYHPVMTDLSTYMYLWKAQELRNLQFRTAMSNGLNAEIWMIEASFEPSK
jgi:hypothetical protein